MSNGNNGTGITVEDFDLPPINPHSVGDRVRAKDRGNVGVVHATDDNSVELVFTSPDGNASPPMRFSLDQVESLDVPESNPARAAYHFLTIPDLKTLAPPRWIIRDILPTDALAVLVGQPSCGKSFLALDWGLSIAAGLGSWDGHATTAGGVVYLAGEGVAGLLRRILAWSSYRLGSPLEAAAPRFFVVPRVPTLLDPADVTTLIAGLKELPIPPSLIVVDTLARCLSGADENSSRDVGGAVEALDRIRRETGASLLIVHHLGKDDTKGARGSSALTGAADAVLSLSKEGGSITLKSTKAKDAEAFAPITLKLEQVTLGPDPDHEGGVITSLRVRPETKREAEDDFTKTQEKILTLLRKPAYRGGAGATEISELTKIPPRSFHRAVNGLLEAETVRKKGTRYVAVLPAPVPQEDGARDPAEPASATPEKTGNG